MKKAARRKPRSSQSPAVDPLTAVIEAGIEQAEDANIREWFQKLLAGDQASSESTAARKPAASRRRKK